MKDNKISRKIMKLELLQQCIICLDSQIKGFEEILQEKQERMKERLQQEEPPENYEIIWIQEDIEKYTIQIDEGKKLRTELEKMA